MNVTSQCVQTQSGTSLTAELAVQAGQWVLATVTTRSATAYPDGWTLVHESAALNSSNTNQRMAMLCRKADADGTVRCTVTQSSAARIYLNLIAFEDDDIAGFAYCEDSEMLQNSQYSSFTRPRPAAARLVWGCSAPTWLTSPRKTWACGDLTAISLPYADQARQANFIDTDAADTRTFVPDTDATAAIIFCVEILEPTVAYRERWLVRSGGTLYKPGDAALTPLADAR